MTRAGAGGLAALLLVAMACVYVCVWGWSLWQGPRPQALTPRDVALGPRALPDPLRITILGTSLSHAERWTDQLEQALNTCLGPTEITVIARPGAGVLWGQGQVAAVARTSPDLVLMEFAINDADLRDGLVPGRADAETRALLGALHDALPGAALVEMTMSPAAGLRGVLRPGLAHHYSAVITRASMGSGPQAHGAIDLYAHWLALPRAERGLSDGLHPDPVIAENVSVAPIRDYIAGIYSAACAV